mmetsp:Transcript_42897/g.104316  ORF Transcript_42897/g.104316 Transcript_42897/m.104316 type:complete len:201 (+) Transcript_42897:393-995(+)
MARAVAPTARIRVGARAVGAARVRVPPPRQLTLRLISLYRLCCRSTSVRVISPSSRFCSSTTGTRPMDRSIKNSSSSLNGMSGLTVGTWRRIHALTSWCSLFVCAAFTTSRYLSIPISLPLPSATGSPLRCIRCISSSACSIVSSGDTTATDLLITSLAHTCSGTCALTLSTTASSTSLASSPSCSATDAAAAIWCPPPP